jgi:hypothetical protein
MYEKKSFLFNSRGLLITYQFRPDLKNQSQKTYLFCDGWMNLLIIKFPKSLDRFKNEYATGIL